MSAWSIALDSIWHHKLRSALTALGIVIGVFAVVTLNSLGAGVKNYITAQFNGVGADLITVTPATPAEQRALAGQGPGRRGGGGGAFGATPSTLTVADATAIAGLTADHVQASAPVEPAPGEAKSATTTATGDALVGTTAGYFTAEPLTFTSGGTAGFAAGAVLGHAAAATLFPNGKAVGQSITVGPYSLPVVGVLESSSSQLGAGANHSVFIPIQDAMSLAGSKYVADIVVSADKSSDVTAVTQAITKLLDQRHTVKDFVAVTAGEILKTVNNTLTVVTDVLGGIAAISLVVGGIGIMNIMLVTVTERVKEIGTRKALGARDGDILVQFLVESVLLAVVGGAIGTGLSGLASHIVGQVIKFPIGLTPSAVTVALAFSVGVGVVFGVLPAMNAARLMPADALRSE